MEALDALLNDLNELAKDLGTDVTPADQNKKLDSSSSSPSSNETADTGFDSCSDYNYSTVKRAPPKEQPVPNNGDDIPLIEHNDFGLDEIMASLDKLDQTADHTGLVPKTRRTRKVSFKSDASDNSYTSTSFPQPPMVQQPANVTKPVAATRPRPGSQAKTTAGLVKKFQPELDIPMQMPPIGNSVTLQRVKPPPPATPPRTGDKYSPSPRIPQPINGSATIGYPRQVKNMVKIERTSSYSSDHSDRSSSGASGNYPSHSPTFRAPPPPLERHTQPPPPSDRYHPPPILERFHPPPPPTMERFQPPPPLATERYYPPPITERYQPPPPPNQVYHRGSLTQMHLQQPAQFHHHQQQQYQQNHPNSPHLKPPPPAAQFNPPGAESTDVSSIKGQTTGINTEKIQIFSSEGSYKWIPIERSMSARYVTQLVAEKHRMRFTARHSLLEYNPLLATERILEEHEKVVEVVKKWGDSKNELHFFERADKWLLFANPQVLMDRVTAEKQTPREERHRYLEQWFPPTGGFRFPGDENAGPRIAETVQLKEDRKDKWSKKYIELRQDKLLVFKKESNREKTPEDVIDMKKFMVYRSLDWRKHFKSPHSNGFCVKMGHVQGFISSKKVAATERIRFFAVEDEFSELKWVTALRLVMSGLQMFINYRNTISSVDQRPSSLLSLRPPSVGAVLGPLPVNSRPSSSESHDQYENHSDRTYKPNIGSTMLLNQPAIPHGVVLREKSVKAPPMTRFYMNNPEPVSPTDFPAPPPFVNELKDLSRRVHEQNYADSVFDHLPPPPPELMLYQARNNHITNGYHTISNRPRPQPPRRNPTTRVHHS